MTCCRLVDLMIYAICMIHAIYKIYIIHGVHATPSELRQFLVSFTLIWSTPVSHLYQISFSPISLLVRISLLSRASHLLRACSYFSEAFFFRAKIRIAAMISASAAIPANSAMFILSPVSGFGSSFSIGYSSTMNCQSSAPMLS